MRRLQILFLSVTVMFACSAFAQRRGGFRGGGGFHSSGGFRGGGSFHGGGFHGSGGFHARSGFRGGGFHAGRGFHAGGFYRGGGFRGSYRGWGGRRDWDDWGGFGYYGGYGNYYGGYYGLGFGYWPYSYWSGPYYGYNLWYGYPYYPYYDYGSWYPYGSCSCGPAGYYGYRGDPPNRLDPSDPPAVRTDSRAGDPPAAPARADADGRWHHFGEGEAPHRTVRYGGARGAVGYGAAPAAQPSEVSAAQPVAGRLVSTAAIADGAWHHFGEE